MSTEAALRLLFQKRQVSKTKWDLNQGAFSIGNLAASPAIFGTFEERKAEYARVRDYMENWLYFLQNDASVPANVREHMSAWGLCGDEFKENDNWPYVPYIRQGPRVVGLKMQTTNQIYDPAQREAAESMGIVSYNLDNKSTTKFYKDGYIWADRSTYVRVPVYEIDWRTMIPVQKSNLLAVVGLSSSPRAYGSLRMEPHFMTFGEFAGAAATMALKSGNSFRRVRYFEIADVMRRRGITLKIRNLCHRLHPRWRMAEGLDPKECRPIAFFNRRIGQ